MADKEENQTQTAIRIPDSLLERMDKLAEQMSKPGLQISRADVHRLGLFRGIGEMEKEKETKKR